MSDDTNTDAAEPVLPDDTVLPDGTYDVFIVDAEADPTDGTSVIRVDITVVSGDHKGEVLSLGAAGLVGSDLDLLGMPATLHVADGRPRLALDE